MNLAKPLLKLFILLYFSSTAWSQEVQQKNSSQDYAGKPIRNISITIKDIFEGNNLSSFYRTVNSLKINTKDEVIRRELLFKEGDPYDKFVIEESERNLRTLGVVNNVKIVPVPNGDGVDVNVTVQDTWTLIPLLNYSSGSGNERRSAGMQEANILGTGKRAEFLYDENDGRTQVQGIWDDRRVWGSHQRLLIGYFDREDGYRTFGTFGLPFRSLLDTHAWSVGGESADTVARLFQNGDERFIFGQKRAEFQSGYTWAISNPDKSVNRFTLGYRFEETLFSEATAEDFDDANVDPNTVSHDPDLLASNRRFSAPFIGFQRIEPDFIALDYIDRFERVQDFNLGNEFSVQSALALDAFGSLEDAMLFSINDSIGSRLSKYAFVRGEVGLANRLESDGFNNTLVRAEVKYFNNLGPKFFGDTFIGNHTLAASFALDYGHSLDKDRELLLGADNGLRGYETKTFTGDKRFILNLEDRFHIADNVLRLVSLGGAVFLDVGASTNRSFNSMIQDEVYADAGVGLRLGFPRSSGGKVFRIDLAFPLRNGPDGSDRFELRVLFKGGQIFSGDLRSEAVGFEKASAEVGLDS